MQKIKPYLFYISIFALIMALSFCYNSLDVDLFSRLIMGKNVVLFHEPMYRDIVSYSNPHIWYDHEWLSSAFFYLIQKFFGIWGLTALKGVCYFGIIVFMSLAVKELNKQESHLNLFLYLIFILSLAHSDIITGTIRCQLITFMLLPLWIFLLEKIKNGKEKILFALPFIILFWLNSHGGAIAALGILFLYIIGEFLNKNYKLSLKLFYSFIFCALAFFINPWGIDFVKFLYDATFVNRSYIGEWQSPFGPLLMDLTIYKAIVFIVPVAFLAELIINKFNFNKINKTKWLVVFATLFLSIRYIKHIYLFLISALIFFYGDFYRFYNFIKNKLTKKNYDLIKYPFIILVIFSYSLYLLFNVPFKENLFKKTIESYPINAINFIKENNIKGKILAPYYISGFIAYKGYPDLKIFMDGRQEQVYPQDYIFKSMNFFQLVGYKPFEILNEFPPDIILFEKLSILATQKNALLNLGYKKVYEDENYCVFLHQNKLRFFYDTPIRADKSCLDNIFDTKILEKL